MSGLGRDRFEEQEGGPYGWNRESEAQDGGEGRVKGSSKGLITQDTVRPLDLILSEKGTSGGC